MLTIIAYVVYLILLIIACVVIKFIINKIFRKDVSKKKGGIFFLIMAVLPLVLFKSCKSCIDQIEEDEQNKKTQESYVRQFLVDNEASSLALPKFKANSYENTYESDKWTLEFEEPIDITQLQKIDNSGVASVNGNLLFFPIILESEEMTEVFDPEAFTLAGKEPRLGVLNLTETSNDDEPDFKYDYRNFKLELLPDGKTAILLYSYHKTYKKKDSSGSSSHHHHHHHHDD